MSTKGKLAEAIRSAALLAPRSKTKSIDTYIQIGLNGTSFIWDTKGSGSRRIKLKPCYVYLTELFIEGDQIVARIARESKSSGKIQDASMSISALYDAISEVSPGLYLVITALNDLTKNAAPQPRAEAISRPEYQDFGEFG